MFWRKKKVKDPSKEMLKKKEKLRVKVEPFTDSADYYHILYKKPGMPWKEFNFVRLYDKPDLCDLKGSKLFSNFEEAVTLAKGFTLDIINEHERDLQALFDDHLKKIQDKIDERRKTFEIEVD